MTFARTLVWINCALFIAFGLGFTFAPAFLASVVTGAEPATPSAVIDMRATYGGMALGLATLFWLCARDEQGVSIGIRGVLGVMVFLALSRLLGIVIDGSPNAFMVLLLAAEVVMAVLAVVALREHSPVTSD
ncbi:DUF4345 domain-containing protein [Vreelandella utahensis]|uniref:DUF4345 domain-containing protein n=1 Tax=Vreelandella halophila TaxID=86177 RepID=UPI0009842A94|nr:DUF4345 domain-containing protein [Halomonas utahensis]